MTNPSTAVEHVKGSTLAVSTGQSFWSAEQLAALKQIGVSNAPNADLAVFLNYAQRTGLDPFARQIYMIGRREKQGNDWGTKWTIQASIDGLRIVAERSGDYAGQVGPEYCGTDGVWRDVWVGHEPPVAARVGVLRAGFAAPLYAVAYFDEYAQMRDGKPTSMWASKPKLMLAKCAEALALRKAFPNDLSGIYTADEMGASEPRTAPAWTPPAPAPQLEAPVDEETGEIVEEPEVQEAEVIEEPKPTWSRSPKPGSVTDPQRKAIHALLKKLQVDSPDQTARVVRAVLGNDVELADLTKGDASKIIDTLKQLESAEDPVAATQGWLAWS